MTAYEMQLEMEGFNAREKRQWQKFLFLANHWRSEALTIDELFSDGEVDESMLRRIAEEGIDGDSNSD
jgi:hypothetical protein